jgi:outer membrane protein insertion porin family
MHSYRGFLLILLSGFVGIATFLFAPVSTHAQQPAQRTVEDVQIIGNRRLRKEDILYWIQIRQGDPFTEAQLQRDMQAILQLGFFDKVKSRVYWEEGPRGGVVVIFEVKELPIIRDLQFEGIHSIAESDILKAFRERHVGVSKESIYDPVKARTAVRVIKELLASHGHPNATVEQKREDISQTSIGLTFVINEAERVRVMEIQFEGNQIFSDKKLRAQMKYVQEAGMITRFQSKDILDREKLDFDLHHVQNYMRSKGYLQARYGEARVEGIGKRRTGIPLLPLPMLSSVDEGLRITVPITEGKIFRIGEIKITGNSIFPEAGIRGLIGLAKGDVANGEKIGKAVYENLKRVYGNQGFIEYTAELSPTFKDNPQNANEGIVDFTVAIDEGKQFSLSRLEFIGNTFTRDNVLRREVLVNEGDIYNQTNWEYSVIKLNQLGYFDPIDKEKDADFKTNEEQATVAIDLKVTEKGRQQISFNGGLSGIGGSFFGLDYSTNNLLGRGEILSLQFAAGNRQKSLQFSFTEPYIRNRPITVGFSIFAFQQQFFGEGTVLSQNTNALQGLTGNPIDALNVNEENLFTRTSYGASVFASAPLSEFYKKRRFTQFSRVGLSYQISQSSVKDPKSNTSGDTATFIPVIYAQDRILTSRVTGSFSFDTRNASIDPTSGKELSLSLALAGLLGDVRTYGPSASYSQFFQVRRKKSEHPEVFGFRLIAGTVGSFATTSKVRNSQSLAFVDGVPIFERFFLGDEFTIRGYNVRSISPITPVDTFVSSRNVVLASNATGTPVQVPGVNQNLATIIGTFTGASGNNSVQLPRSFTPIGADTQFLGNFEYRIPILGDKFGAAFFTDIGTAFNLRSKHDQVFSSNFLDDEPFLQTTGAIKCARVDAGAVAVNLSSLAGCNANQQLALIGVTGLFPALVMRDNRLVTSVELENARTPGGPFDPVTGLPAGFQQVFLRGQAQTNTAVRLSQSLFINFSDYRASMGIEFRLQVPVINVPFRLIFAYNPSARKDQVIDGFPLFFNEKRFVPRFSIGRTF